MTLQQLLITLSLFSSFLCMNMNRFPEKEFINFDQITDYYIQDDFKTKWGYSIPIILVKETINGKPTYKTVSHSYVTQRQNNHTIEIQDTFDTVPHIKMPQLKIVDPAEKLLKQKVEESLLLIDKLIAENTHLKKELGCDKKTSSPKIMQPKIITTKPKIKTNWQKKRAIPKKKKNFSSITPNNKPIIQKNTIPQNSSSTNESQQKMSILRDLMKRYKVQAPRQLKDKLAAECNKEDYPGIWGRIDKYCTWSYCKATNELIINTHDIESDTESDDASSGSREDSSSDPSLD